MGPRVRYRVVSASYLQSKGALGADAILAVVSLRMLVGHDSQSRTEVTDSRRSQVEYLLSNNLLLTRLVPRRILRARDHWAASSPSYLVGRWTSALPAD